MQNSQRSFWPFATIVVLLIAAGLATYYLTSGSNSGQTTSSMTGQTSTGVQGIQAVFSCAGGKSINATFVNSTSSTTTGNYVQLTLSDGRQMTLQQTISADGARYSNGNPQLAQGQPGAETFVFWNKGNGAIVNENGSSSDYTNCTTQNQR